MNWDYFIYLASISVCCWITASILALFPKKKKLSTLFSLAGCIVYSTFIILYWIHIERPPLKTMGETRLWYSFFLSIAGLLTYYVWNYRSILSFTTLMSVVFIIITILKPEIQSKELMPALQSKWFIPHVTMFMFSYSFLGISFLLSLIILIKPQQNLLQLCDNVVYIGIAAFIIGLLLGSLWAKEAWGQFWSWDPKETWALITLTIYLLYVNGRKQNIFSLSINAIVLIMGFIALQICWWGIKYLPSAQNSIHLYN